VLKIHKYIQPGYFFMGTKPPIQASFRHQKSFIFFFQEACQVASLKGPIMQLNANALRNADIMTSSICATSHCSVAVP
jgi:hypothetical protein